METTYQPPDPDPDETPAPVEPEENATEREEANDDGEAQDGNAERE